MAHGQGQASATDMPSPWGLLDYARLSFGRPFAMCVPLGLSIGNRYVVPVLFAAHVQHAGWAFRKEGFKRCRVVRVERRHTSPYKGRGVPLRVGLEPGIALAHWNCGASGSLRSRVRAMWWTHPQLRQHSGGPRLPSSDRRGRPGPPLGQGPSNLPGAVDGRDRGGFLGRWLLPLAVAVLTGCPTAGALRRVSCGFASRHLAPSAGLAISRALSARFVLVMADSVDALRVGGALAYNGSGRSAGFASVAEEDRPFARPERAQNGAGGFQDGVPAVRPEHDVRVQIAAIVDERRTVAAHMCVGASPHGRRTHDAPPPTSLLPRPRRRGRDCERGASSASRER